MSGFVFQVSTLKQQLFVEKDLVIEECKIKNAFLADQIEAMKKIESASSAKKVMHVFVCFSYFKVSIRLMLSFKNYTAQFFK